MPKIIIKTQKIKQETPNEQEKPNEDLGKIAAGSLESLREGAPPATEDGGLQAGHGDTLGPGLPLFDREHESNEVRGSPEIKSSQVNVLSHHPLGIPIQVEVALRSLLDASGPLDGEGLEELRDLCNVTGHPGLPLDDLVGEEVGWGGRGGVEEAALLLQAGPDYLPEEVADLVDHMASPFEDPLSDRGLGDPGDDLLDVLLRGLHHVNHQGPETLDARALTTGE